jgi:phosphoribosylglycinamide formyltransferase-1
MKKTNIAVLVSGGGTNLQALIDAEKAGIIRSGSIKLVVSNNKDAYALTRAKNNSIDTRVVLRRDYENSHDFEAALIGVLKEADIDMIVLAGFMSILSPDFIAEFHDRMINVHPSLIPSFCGKGFYGLHVHEAALEYGVKVTGATVHFVNEIPDGGKIILQKAVEVQEGDTPEVLQRRVMEQAEWIILPQATEMVAAQLAERK